ncbi:MAG: polysaccharide biosynthesis C-terminal domain-containing protein, partial [Bacteroidota bacterium]
VGIYAHAFRIMDAANQLAYLFAILLLPIFSKMIKEKQPLFPMIKMPLSLLLSATYILAIGSLMYSFELMDLLYFDKIKESAAVLSVLIFGTVAVASSYVFGTLLTANGNLKILIGIAAFSMMLSFTLNILLIPKYFALGAAIANVSALFSSAAMHLIFAYKQLNIQFTRKFIFQIAVFAVLIPVLAFLTNSLSNNWLINMGAFVGIALLISFVVGLFDLRQMYNILFHYEKVGES